MKRALIFAAALVLLSGVAHAAPTFTANEVTVFGNLRVVFGSMAFDSSYPTGGEGATRSQLSVGRIVNSTVMVQVEAESGYTFEYDYTNSKVQAYNGGGSTVAGHTHTATTDGHTHTATTSGHTHTVTVTDSTTGTAIEFLDGAVHVSGATANITSASATDTTTTASTTDTATTASGGAITAAVGTEVANATDLSALTGVRYIIYGR